MSDGTFRLVLCILGVFAVLALAGVVACGLLGKPVPPELSALGVQAITGMLALLVPPREQDGPA